MYSKEFYLQLYRTMFTIRHFELRCMELYKQAHFKGYFHPYLGEEAIAVGACAALDTNDYIVSTHRGHGHCLARGAVLEQMFAEVLGKKTGYGLGLGGSMHITDMATGNLGANGIVGGGIALGVGAALGSSIRGEQQVTLIFFSDGASNNGIFSESLNFAAVYNLPVVFILENNHYASCTPVERASRETDLYKIGIGYGVTSEKLDGNNVFEVYEHTRKAVDLCKSGKGPVLLECKTYRHGGHHVNDAGDYMPQDTLAYYKAKDPLALCRKQALAQNSINEDDLAALETNVTIDIEEAVQFALESAELSLPELTALVKDY